MICIVEWIVNLVANLGLFTIFLIFGEVKFASITLGIFVLGKFVVHVLSATWRCDDLTPDGLDKNCYRVVFELRMPNLGVESVIFGLKSCFWAEKLFFELKI